MKILGIAFLGVLLFFVCELFRRYRKIAWFMVVVLPVILTPFWLNYQHTTFIWFKLYSMIAISIAILAYAVPAVEKIERYHIIVLAFICLNIVEAVVQNAHTGVTLNSWPHLANALAGALIIFALPYRDFLKVGRGNKRTVVLCDFPSGIIISYTVWNWLFIYLEWPDFIGIETMLLAVPLASMFINKGLWVETRIYSLALYLMFHFTWPDIVDKLNLIFVPSLPLGKALAVIAVICSIGAVWQKRRRAVLPS